MMISIYVFCQASFTCAKKKALQLDAAPPLYQVLQAKLTETERKQISQIRADPAPEEIVRNSHYWVSNEHHHELWYPYIKDSKGAYVGVGTDQNYLLAGWAKPELLILMDFDGEIKKLHQIYHFFFKISASPQDFIKRWHKHYRQDSIDKLTAHFTQLQQTQTHTASLSKKKAKRYIKSRVKIYKLIQSLIYRRLRKTLKKYRALKLNTFLDDETQYNFIRSLWKQGRVLAIRGDLTAQHTMLDLASTLKKINMPLNVLYLSNAEQYFPLTPEYRRNIIAQNWGERSYALRTLGWRILGYVEEDEKYHYNVQGGLNFKQWLEVSRTTKAGRILIKAGEKTKTPGFSIVKRAAKPSKSPPKIAPMP
jgi:hypothetical protein